MLCRLLGCPEGVYIYLQKTVRKKVFYPGVFVFLLFTSTLCFRGLHTADAICKVLLQFSVKLLAGGKVSQKKMKMKETARQYLIH